ncbi:MAG: hypothetical protein NTW67_01255 [Candidatus Woesearchaeota archaeon]|nr:hypothetical protein [Candidatus Woesearchaeota archaeon]
MKILKNIGKIILDEARYYVGGAVIAGLSLLPMACSSEDTEPLPPAQQPTLEQRIILNEGDDVKLGDNFFIGSLSWPQETLKYVGRDEANKTLKFTKPGTSFTREITYDDGFGTLVVNGQTHGVHVNDDGSLRIDMDASNTVSNNSTHAYFRQNLIVDNKAKIITGDYFFIKNADGDFMPYQVGGQGWGDPQRREVIFADLHNLVDRHYFLQDDGAGNFQREIDFNGTKILVSGVLDSEEITVSSFDGKSLECLLTGTIVANEGRSIKPNEHFLIDTMDSPTPKGEVWKYIGDVSGDSNAVLRFRKCAATGFEYQDVVVVRSVGEGTILTSGFAYRVRLNADNSVNIDLDKSGSIEKNEIPLLDRLVFNEKRDIAGGDVFVLENATETEQFHSAYSLQLIDTVNKRIMVTNRNQGTIGEYSFSDEGDGTIVSSGISHSFKVTSPTTIQIDMNGDGKIE